MTEQTHLTATDKNRAGDFIKARSDVYRTTCEVGGRGFLGTPYQAHHIVPKTSIDTSIEDLAASKQRLVETRKHFTPWDLNHANNLVGLPVLSTFVQHAAATAGGIKPKARGQSALSQRKSKGNSGPTPDGRPMHNPVTWGHLQYNVLVGDGLDKFWDDLEANRRNHKVIAKDMAATLKALETRFYRFLHDRGKEARKFTMHAAAMPLGDRGSK